MISNAKILIVDDEAQIAKQTESKIKKMGYSKIRIATTYKKAMQYIKDDLPDLILLDINLESDKNGIDLATEKEVFHKIPIIYITGYSNKQNIKALIESNFKHYINKPINDEVLEMNMEMALDYRQGIIDIGHDFSYDFDKKELFYQKEPFSLSKYQKILLERLINGKGEAVSTKLLEFEVWGSKLVADNALRMLIKSLREKLNKDMIITVPSLGYRLDLPKDEI